jgi:glycosyl hydrolase family 57
MRRKLSIKGKMQLQSILVKNQRTAIMVGVVVLWAALAGFAIYQINKPLVSTGYYHANIQFRAGDEDSYDEIFNQSLSHIVDMYYDHPTWIWSLECQGLLIEMAYENYPDVFLKMQKMNQRGQLELITPQYSHALAVAYNYKDFAESIIFNKNLLEGVYNMTISNVFILQEGQWLPAFPLIKHLGFDTMLVSRDQLSYQNYFPNKALLSYSFGNIPAYVMPVVWLPTYEAGSFHHHLALSDSERMNTGGEGAVEGDYAFNFNPEKQKQIEKRHMELENKGNIFMNMSDWVKRCIEKKDIEPMNKFMPESHWTPNRHESVSRWMAWGNGESDDGIVHARNYYTRNLIQSAEIMTDIALKQSKITQTTYNYCKNLTNTALKHLWLSQVTDTSGVNPNDYEFEYCINNTALAQNYSQQVINLLKSSVVGWNNRLQVDGYHKTVITQESRFQNLTVLNQISNISILENKYGFNSEITYTHQNSNPYVIGIQNYSLKLFVNNSLKEFQFEKIQLSFQSRRDQFVSNKVPILPVFNNSAACNGKRSEQHIKFNDNWKTAAYSPSLAENYTQTITRDDYHHPAMGNDPYYKVPLPISNGLLYNIQKGYAIITHNTVRHISVRWENDVADFYEKEIQYNSNYEFLCFKGSLQEAHLLSLICNPYPILEVQ